MDVSTIFRTIILFRRNERMVMVMVMVMVPVSVRRNNDMNDDVIICPLVVTRRYSFRFVGSR